jgi:Cdc6-like AAA superfamily ATPase
MRSANLTFASGDDDGSAGTPASGKRYHSVNKAKYNRRAAAETLPVIQKKVALLGAPGVGKTSLVRRFVDSLFDDKYLTTIGVKVDTLRADRPAGAGQRTVHTPNRMVRLASAAASSRSCVT